MALKIYQVDAFSDRPFKGNPAGVCILTEPRDDAWMQNVALEMNLAETAFLTPRNDGYGLRWFTPVAEVELCGHATLASAHILWETARLSPKEGARFHTLSGVLTAVRRGEEIELDFPATPAAPAKAPDGLLEALGTTAKWLGLSRFDYLVELDSEDKVRGLKPDFGKLKAISARGVIVTSPGTAPYDFVSRFFAPAVGIDEDPVTGSAHCTLAPFWAERFGKNEMTGYQASARGGVVRVRLEGDRVKLGGRAVTTIRGELVGS